MGEQKYTYTAFISYKHAELDSFVAEKIHKRLESYRVPRSVLRSKQGKNLKTRSIGRIFRDRDELPTASNLSDQINKALEESQFLIVICSPRTKQSAWVMQEIETFIKLHGRENVLCVLIEGEPEDSFPEMLRYEEVEQIEAYGSITMIKKEIEPLAADVRATTYRKCKQLIKGEILRLLAPMLGCSYDTLKQRHRERRQRQIMTGLTVIIGFLLLFGGFSLYQNKLIEKNLQESLRMQSRYLATVSEELLYQGDRENAVMVAKYALPEGKNDNRPYVAGAEGALSRALGVYRNGAYYSSVHTLVHDNSINYLDNSDNGRYVLSMDMNNVIYIWDVQDGTLLRKYEEFDTIDTANTFITDTMYVISEYNSVRGYSLATGESLFEEVRETIITIVSCPKENYLALIDNGAIVVYDMVDGSKVKECSSDIKVSYITDIYLLSSDYLAVVEEIDSKSKISVIALNDGHKMYDITIPSEIVSQIVLHKDYLLVSAFSVSNQKANGVIKCLNIKDGTVDWENNDSSGTRKIEVIDEENLAIIGFNTIDIVDLHKGSSIFNTVYSSQIMGVENISNSTIVVALADGDLKYLIYSVGFEFSNIDYCNGIEDIAMSLQYMCIISGKTDEIAVFTKLVNENIQLFTEDGSIKECFYVEDDKTILYCDTNKVYRYDIDTKETKQLKEFDQDIVQLWQNSKKEIVVLLLDGTVMKSLRYDFNEVQEYKGEYSKFKVSGDGNTIFLYDDDSMILYDTTEMKKTYETTQEYFYVSNCVLSYNGKVAVYYTGDELAIIKDGVEVLRQEGNIGTFTISKDGERICYIDKEDNKLVVFDTLALEELISERSSSNLINSVSFSQDGKYIAVSYTTQGLYIKDSRTLKTVARIEEEDSEIVDFHYNITKGVYLLETVYNTYLMNEELQVKAELPLVYDIAEDLSEAIVSVYSNGAVTPIYTLEQLLNEAKNLYGDTDLTENEKDMYYIK